MFVCYECAAASEPRILILLLLLVVLVLTSLLSSFGCTLGWGLSRVMLKHDAVSYPKLADSHDAAAGVLAFTPEELLPLHLPNEVKEEEEEEEDKKEEDETLVL